MNKIKVIIFDYDGVIAESVNVKTEAFAELYKPFGSKVVKKVIEHHEANGGVSRFEKFKIYHKKFLSQELDDNKLKELNLEFSNLVLQKVIDSPYVKGAHDFISSHYDKYQFYISTGTPSNEIEIILQKKNIRKFFKKVYGSPEKKDLHVKKILEDVDCKKNEVVFVGDALSDRNAARLNGINFIGRYTTSEVIKNEKYLMENYEYLEQVLYRIEGDMESL